MKLIAKPRGTGKTTELVKLCQEKGGYLVVRDRKTAHTIFRKAYDQDIHIPMPISYDDFLERRYHGVNCSPLWIDDVDALLNYIAKGADIGGITFTPERSK